MCTALPIDEIYPPTKFHNHSLVLEISTGQNLSKKAKGNNSKLNKQELLLTLTLALHSPLLRSIHPQNFITIGSIVLEICTGQNSSMKENKGQ